MPATSVNARATHLTVNHVRLDALKEAHGITSDVDLAERIGVHPSTLIRVRQGKAIASNEFLAKIAAAFPNATLDALFHVVKGEE